MSNVTILSTDCIDPRLLPEVLHSVYQVSPLQYLIAEWWQGPGIFDTYLAGIEEIKNEPDGYPEGQAFGPGAEVAWRQIGDTLRMTLVAERDIAPLMSAEKTETVQWTRSDESHRVRTSRRFNVILWGTQCVAQDTNDCCSTWMEARIPRRLRYPILPGPANAKEDYEAIFLQVMAYYDARGRPVIYRRFGLCARLEHPERLQRRARGEDLSSSIDQKEATEEVAIHG